MYASALKFCGAMEVCGLGFPRDKPIDYQWPDVLAQAAAQNAAQLICYSRDHKPEEAEFLRSKGFLEVYSLRNPRTGSSCRLWIYTFPAAMGLHLSAPELAHVSDDTQLLEVNDVPIH